MKAITLADARNLYVKGLLTMLIDKRGHIVCMVNGLKVKVTRRGYIGREARAAYYARSLRIGG